MKPSNSPLQTILSQTNTILSIAAALITIVQICIKVRWYVYVLTLGGILLIWLSYYLVILLKKPWASEMGNPLLDTGHGTPLKRYFSTVFCKPYYESSYQGPASSVKPDSDSGQIDGKRLTVVIEDDPVGFACPFGMLPCIPLEDDITSESLYTRLMEADKKIRQSNFLFLATASRRMDAPKSMSLNKEIGIALRRYFNGKDSGEVRIISKIDSCLRSNYEPEYEGLTDGLGKRDCLEILVPAYIEQGRITIHGSQYIKENGKYNLVEDSEYSSFIGLEYSHSDLALWLEERAPHIPGRKKVGLVDIDVLRSDSPEAICERMLACSEKNVRAFVFDAAEKEDLSLILGVISRLEQLGQTLFLKFGPSMINRYAMEYSNSPVENKLEGIRESDNGIFIVGSLTSITKRQVEKYDYFPNTSIVTIRESELSDIRSIDETVGKRSENIIKKNKDGDDVILTTEYWKTELNEYPDIPKRDNVLFIFSKICQRIRTSEKRWFLLKGSDTALFTMLNGLGIKEFYYCGQYIPGVIHCKCELSGRLKSFFIVGGNVGTPDLLVRLREAIIKEISA